MTAQSFRIGFAAQGHSEFSREVMKSMEIAATREHLHLITVNNRYSAREALRNPTSSSSAQSPRSPSAPATRSSRSLSKILRKKTPPSTVFVKPQFITPRNVDLNRPLDDRLEIKLGFPHGRSRPSRSSRI